MTTRFDPSRLRAFLWGRTLHAFDPDTRAHVATVAYGNDGTCRAEFADGTRDEGRYGLEGDTYWTRYAGFRGGETNAFHLVPVAPDIAQAYHTDGRRAFLQGPRADLDGLPPRKDTR